MRYAKLGLGVLLALAGIYGTIGALWGAVWYVRTCPGGDWLAQHLCPGELQQTVLWAGAAVSLDVGAILSLRFRTRSWISRGEP
jgi:hypothetical protein